MTIEMRLVKRYTVLFLLVVALLLSLPPIFHRVQASATTIHLVGNASSGWNGTNPQIPVLPGETVTIVLSSGDSAPHQFLLDLDKDGVADTSDCPTTDPCSSVFSSSSTSVTFTAPSSGTFTYYCTVHPLTMFGTLVVQTPTPDFTISSSPSSLTIGAGSSANSTISLASQNGFTGTVNLVSTVTPTGPSTTFNSTSISVSSGGSGASKLTISTTGTTPSGSYTVKVNGTSGTLDHQTIVTVVVTSPPSQDFSITTNPMTLNLALGSTATTTITLSGTNGFSGILTLSGTVAPSSTGPSLSFSPSSVTVSSGGQATSTLTISAVGASVATGNYSVNVTATNGSLAHSKVVQVTVGSPTTTPPGIGNLPLNALVGAAVVIVAAAGIAIYLVRRRTVSK